jgi:hypothetical protein
MSCIVDENQFRICVPASDAINGRLGDGVEDILGLRNGERSNYTPFANVTNMRFSASGRRVHQI